MKKLLAVVLFTLLAACATSGNLFGPTPEAQILTGANAVTAQAGVATVLLKNNKITAAQARSYSNLLHAGGSHLDDANKALLACRASTGSTSKSSPDPCKATVADDLELGLSVIDDVKKALAAKQ